MKRPTQSSPEFNPIDCHSAEPSLLFERIREAHIVGMGGGGFPTAQKLRIVLENAPTTFVVNVGATEFDRSPDPILLSEYSDTVLCGIFIIQRILDPVQTIVAIANKVELKNPNRWSRHNIRIHKLDARFPEGEERSLLRQTLGTKLDPASYPAETGIAVLNIATVFAVAEAVQFGYRPSDRLVCVEGENRWIAFEEPLERIAGPAPSYRVGGPLRGIRVPADMSVSATTFAVSVDRLRSPRACIHCGACDLSCPLTLPVQQLLEDANNTACGPVSSLCLPSCYECGACTASCPSEIPVLDLLRESKSRLSQEQVGVKMAEEARRRYERRIERKGRLSSKSSDHRVARMLQEHEWERRS